MAKNDMEVIEYKILAYLYESLKAGHTTALEEEYKKYGFEYKEIIG